MMILSADLIEKLAEDELLSVRGGLSIQLFATNNGTGRCDGTNNGSGYCEGDSNNGSGTCGPTSAG